MTYLAGTDLAIEYSLLDAEGASIDATSVDYRVLDGNGTVVQATQTLSGFTGGSDVTLTIPALTNTLSGGLVKDAREIEFTCTLADGSKKYASYVYFIESSSSSLSRGTNTLVTLAGAELLANEIPSIGSWKTASKASKIAALLEAYRRLGKLRLTSPNSYYVHVYVPEPSLLEMTPSEILALDTKLLYALSIAQVSEADAILSGDNTDSRRQDGLVLETVGEVKQMYRNNKPVEMPVNRRTLSYLSQYVSIGVKVVGRG